MTRVGALVAVLGSVAAMLFGTRVPAAQPPAPVDFVRDVQPILQQQCYGCHGPTQQMNGFRLDRRREAMRGGTIAVIGPGTSDGSRLYQRLIGNQYGPQMPPTGALRPEQTNIIKDWIDQGAVWPDEASGEVPVKPLDARSARLMEATFRGDTATVRALLDEGADVNVKNEAGASPLMRAVYHVDTAALLLDRGANVNAKSDDGRTPLLIAAGLPDGAAIVKLLLDHGADPSAAAPSLGGPTTPLTEAAFAGNETVFRLLIERGADVKRAGPGPLGLALRAQCMGCVEAVLNRMDRDAITATMVIGSPPIGPALATGFLLEHGGDINARDAEGRTLLMLAAASGALPVDVVKALIAKGADVNTRTARGETALGLAKRHGKTAVVDLLVRAGAVDVAPAPGPSAQPAPAASPRTAIERTLPLIQQNDVAFLKKAGCVSCHNNTLTAVTVAAARAGGFRVDETIAQRQLTTIGTYIDTWRERALQGIAIPGDADTVSYIMLGLASEKYPANAATDAMAFVLKRQQVTDGHWRISAERPPIESNDIAVTALSMRALQVYAPAADRAEYQQAVARAAAWLRHADPHSTEEQAFRVLGLAWSGADKATIDVAARTLVEGQRSDGGWAQIATLTSDAYATGEALVALTQSSAIAVTSPAYRRGVDFLLKTQYGDGSWFVSSRALPLQPHFESGFPYGRHQFISAAATNWATQALIAAARGQARRSFSGLFGNRLQLHSQRTLALTQ
jgi:ankyrin repeat protein/mono/diheme cytochrome c family protein